MKTSSTAAAPAKTFAASKCVPELIEHLGTRPKANRATVLLYRGCRQIDRDQAIPAEGQSKFRGFCTRSTRHPVLWLGRPQTRFVVEHRCHFHRRRPLPPKIRAEKRASLQISEAKRNLCRSS